MTASTPPQDDIDARLAAAGIVVPADLKAGVHAEAGDLLRVVSLLRTPRTAAAEPFSTVWPMMVPPGIVP